MLREYQIKFIRALALALKQSKRVIACLPTGGGKTKCFLEIARLSVARNRSVLIISESRKIFTQIQQEANGIEINAKVGQHLYVQPNHVYIAMAQTLIRRPFILDQFQKMGETLLVINDEAHIGTSTRLLRELPNALLIGFTATPVYESAKHLPELYKACVVGAQVSDLINDGYLCPYRHYARVGAELDKLQIKNGEFTEESNKAAFENNSVFDGLLEDIQKIPGKKRMIFCSSIAHAEDVYEMLQFNSIACVRYHSKHEFSSSDLRHFEYGDIDTCISVAALNKGYDNVKIDWTALLFATTSLPRYLQSIGRQSRISEGKYYSTTLDYGANYMRHGLWDADRPYETLWMRPNKKHRSKEILGVASVKNCPDCMAIIPASTQVCPFCAAVLREEKELQQGELVEITGAYTEMVGRKISTLTAQELAVYAKLKNKKPFAIRIARAKEQSEPGFLELFGREMGYSYRWPFHQRELITNEKIEFADIVLK